MLEHTVFILLIIIWVIILGMALYRVQHNTALYEQLYAKEIALVIDRAEPGMEVQFDLTRAYNLATKNNLKGEIMRIDPREHTIIVRLTDGKGYSYHFFNNAVISWNADKTTRKIFLTFYPSDSAEGNKNG